MSQALAADAVVAIHFAFVVYAVIGGLAAIRWPLLAVPHLACAAWAVWIELSGNICPLTPLELELRRAAGESGYEGGFIQHYLFSLLYPEGLTREFQIGLGLAVLAVNIVVYAFVWRAIKRRRAGPEWMSTREHAP